MVVAALEVFAVFDVLVVVEAGFSFEEVAALPTEESIKVEIKTVAPSATDVLVFFTGPPIRFVTFSLVQND